MIIFVEYIMRKLFYFLICCGFFSCEEKVEIAPPANIINASKMVYILTDIHIADAAINLNNEYPKDILLDKQSLYNDIYKKHKVRKAQFDSSFTYYSGDMDKMWDIYNDMLIVISEKQAAIQSTNP